jgi:hypothetical protein
MAIQHYRAHRTIEIAADPTSAFAGLSGPGARPGAKQARNALCACGSGRKYKICCLHLHEAAALGDRAAARETARLDAFEGILVAGKVGLCKKGTRPKSLGGPEGDFVEGSFLCDRWDGRTGSSVATEGHALDKLPDELKDKLGDPE